MNAPASEPLVLTSRNGPVLRLALNRPKARNALGETSHSTPAVAGGRMYIHTSQHLFSIGGTEPGARE